MFLLITLLLSLNIYKYKEGYGIRVVECAFAYGNEKNTKTETDDLEIVLCTAEPTSSSSLGSLTIFSNLIFSAWSSSGFPLEAGTTPRRSSPSSVRVPVLSKQTQSRLPDTLIVRGEMQ